MNDSKFAYGTMGWIVRRAQWSALGLTEEDFQKPKIAVVNSSSSLSICYSQVDEIARHVQDGIREAGGYPFEIRTVAPSDGLFSSIGQGAALSKARQTIVDDIELMIQGTGLDGMVLLSSCDSTTPAHLRAAARLDIPSIVVPCGYQVGTGGHTKQTSLYNVYEGFGFYLSGKIDFEEIDGISARAVGCPGVCPGIATANTMHLICEALGIALPGSSPICGGSTKLRRFASKAGSRIVDLAHDKLTARQLMTKGSFINAIMTAAAVGGSTSAITFLEEIAPDAELDIDIRQELKNCVGRVPLLCKIVPNGEVEIADFEAAGGTLGVMKQLSTVLNTDLPTVGGGKLGDQLKAAPMPDKGVIGSLQSPMGDSPGIVVLNGEIAPGGALYRPFTNQQKGVFTGPARCIDGMDKGVEALRKGEIKPGDVLVMHGISTDFASLLHGSGVRDVAIVSDSGIIGMGRGPIMISEVRPRFDEGGPISKIKDGDRIAIDLEKHTVHHAS